ncbi:class I ribonucleotide reductase maintenance protein YfaE [Denitrificimonas sp. JX-1]|uniref:Class I ribonucleotide reductase maintenance protein YfaE n=1 Tax=Denitrificimonas halotolerans TaxID=3098930 RepID=A0ABU5GQ92_9GAMM|nr:class I ribonucleotide reductase maintenance protein YfaE [Denitrificimonas sp. JX-1]MDY7219153.1 class I ribonucleotide reductase maintenance protein YfaE [Denitrificimonas sp. JX-1]
MKAPIQVITEDLIFKLEPSETLLEGLERTGHQVEYQCRSGYCGACRVSLRSGSVSYANTPLAFLRQDEILPCCCLAEEPLVVKVSLKSKYSIETQED